MMENEGGGGGVTPCQWDKKFRSEVLCPRKLLFFLFFFLGGAKTGVGGFTFTSSFVWGIKLLHTCHYQDDQSHFLPQLYVFGPPKLQVLHGEMFTWDSHGWISSMKRTNGWRVEEKESSSSTEWWGNLSKMGRMWRWKTRERRTFSSTRIWSRSTVGELLELQNNSKRLNEGRLRNETSSFNCLVRCWCFSSILQLPTEVQGTVFFIKKFLQDSL